MNHDLARRAERWTRLERPRRPWLRILSPDGDWEFTLAVVP